MNGEKIVLFDGVCNYCNRMVNFAIRNDPRARLKFAPMQSPAGQRLKQQYGVTPQADSIVFIENGRPACMQIPALASQNAGRFFNCAGLYQQCRL
jgi:predicted DCC family thiol-disulfide oxidoreductase YuxK